MRLKYNELIANKITKNLNTFVKCSKKKNNAFIMIYAVQYYVPSRIQFVYSEA